jgi:hypothetical protein
MICDPQRNDALACENEHSRRLTERPKDPYERAAKKAVDAANDEYGFDDDERSQLTTAVEAALADIEDARERARDCA